MTRVQRGRANRLDPALSDGLLAGGLVVMGVVGLLLGTGGRVLPDGSESPTALAWLLMLGQGLPVAWRRKAPLAMLAVVELATVAYFLLQFPPTGAARTGSLPEPRLDAAPSRRSGAGPGRLAGGELRGAGPAAAALRPTRPV